MRTRLVAITLFLFSSIGTGILYASNNDEAETVNWQDLTKVEWVWEDGFYQAIFNDAQKALDGKTMIVEGFMFPLEYTRRHQNFLVSSAPMGNCFFCGPGEAESMVYVQTEEPVEYSQRPMKVKGTFKLVSDASMGIIYELKDAKVIR